MFNAMRCSTATGPTCDLLTMRAVSDDRTARAVIRDEALRMFAVRGPDAVRLREIAAAAGVSPGLVVHHFGSLDGLRAVVDQYVVDTFDAILAEAIERGAPDPYGPVASGAITTLLAAHLPADSPIPGYLRRMLLAGTDQARELFARLQRMSRAALDDMVAAGVSAPGADPDVRAAFLMVNDLALLLLRDRLTETLGVDPLSPEGMRRWSREALAVYGAGLRAPVETHDGRR
jgi:AcrR family transcriptional regulator